MRRSKTLLGAALPLLAAMWGGIQAVEAAEVFSVPMTATDGAAITIPLTFGMDTDATDGWDSALDAQQPPGPPAFSARFLIDGLPSYVVVTDYRSEATEKTWPLQITLNTIDTVIVNWGQITAPYLADKSLRLVGTSTDIDMLTQTSANLTASETYSIVLSQGGTGGYAPTGTANTWRPEFSWPATDGAEYYVVDIDVDGAAYYEAWVLAPTLSWAPTWDLERGTTYTWSVGTLIGGDTTYSRELSFVVDPPAPVAITQTYPTGSISETQPLLQWEKDPGAVWYYVVMRRQGEGTDYYTTWLQTTSFQVNWDLPAGTYDWYVAAWAEGNFGPWGTGLSFTVGGTSDKATNLSPSGGVVLSENPPTLTWTPASVADYHYLIIIRDGVTYASSFWQNTDQWVAAPPLRTWRLLLPQGNYEWYVQTWTYDGATWAGGEWSDGASFTVNTTIGEPTKPVLNSPTGVVSGASPLFTWSNTDSTQWNWIVIQKDGGDYFEYWQDITYNNQFQTWWDFAPGTYTWYAIGWNEWVGMSTLWSDAATFTVE